MSARLALVVAALALAPRAHAQTPVDPGPLTTTTAWTLAGSPYAVRGDVVVPAGVTLTVDPDVVVRFAVSPAGANLGEDAARSELIVDGSLVVSGGIASRARFRADSLTDQPNQWYGILVRDGGSALLDGAEISTAWSCLTLRTAENVYVWNSLLRRCGVGALVTAGTATFDAVEITSCNTYGIRSVGAGIVGTGLGIHHNNADGVYVEDAGADIGRSAIHDNGGNGVHAVAHYAGAGADVVRNTIVSNRASATRFERYAGAGGVGGEVRDNILAKSGTYAIEQTSGAYLTVRNNLLFGYSGNPYSGGLVVWDDLKPQENPLFVDEPAGDLRITRYSPARLHSSTGGDVGAYDWAGEPAPFLAGHLHENVTLTAAASPHVLEGTLTVAPGATLTVEPGATVRAETTDVMGLGSSFGPMLKVDGTLVAAGTDVSPVTFDAVAPTRVAWMGIALGRWSGPSVIEHARIANAWSCIGTSSPAARVTRSELESCTTGISATGATVVDGVEIHGGWDGVVVTSGAPVLRNLVVHDNEANGIELDSQYATSVEIVHATVADNGGAGLSAHRGSGFLWVRVQNGIFARNGTYGIQASGTTPVVTVDRSDVWGNASADAAGVTLGQGSLSVDPEFVSTTDYRLASTSPLVDLGLDTGLAADVDGNLRPVDANGCDGALPDLGAYEAASAGSQTPVAVAGPDVSVFVGDEIPFNGTPSFDHCGSIASYHWAFGDGTTAAGAVPAGHAYASAGDYVVTLTVTDAEGATAQDTLVAHVAEPADLLPPSIAECGMPGGPWPAGQALPVCASIGDPSGVATATVHYRVSGGGTFSSVVMTLGAGTDYSAEIPGAAVQAPGVEWYLEAVDGSPAANVARSPAGAPAAFHTYAIAAPGSSATGGGDGGGGGCRTAGGGGWALVALVLLVARAVSARRRAGTAAARSARPRSRTA